MPIDYGGMPGTEYVFEVSARDSRPQAYPSLSPDFQRLTLGRAQVVIRQLGARLGDEPSMVVRRGLLVVAHGCIDYRGDLGFHGGADASTAEIVAEAFSRWDVGITDRLEGDFSAVVWDEDAGKIFACRTFPGPYPLFYSDSARRPGALVLSSSVAGVLAHPDVDAGLNIAAVAEAASGLMFGEHGETCRRSVRVLDSGWALQQQGDARPQRIRAWKPAVDPSVGPRSQGPERLMELVRAAVGERACREGSTAIWLSGGFDSSAVFAAAMSLPQNGSLGDDRFRPVSITYPEGDVAREDEWIKASVSRWKTSSVWIDSERIPVRLEFEESARNRDQPFVHLFDTWNAALAEASHSAGARVALGGDGGDQLFQSAPIHLADLARTLRPIQLLREYRGLGGRSARGLMRWALMPLVPRPIARFYEGFKGIPFQDTMRVAPPAWVPRDFVKRHALLDRNREMRAQHLGRNRTAREIFRLASSPFFGRVATEVRRVARTHGVLHRSPLWDRRIVEFALTRPFSERVEGGESKILLRAAMRGLIPEEVLAPRSHRTGAPDSVFHRFMREGVLPAIDRLGDFEHLADLGVMDPKAFNTAVAHYREFPSFFLGVQIAFSLDTECWLRGWA